MSDRIEGTIKRLVADRGYGFIQAEDRGKDIFFHLRVLQGVRFEDLEVGDRVVCEVREGDKGPAAIYVERTATGRPFGTEPAPGGARYELSGRSRGRGEYRFYNPYNFVRFLALQNKVSGTEAGSESAGDDRLSALAQLRDKLRPAGPEPSPTDVPLLGRCAPPPHDRYVGLSGRIRCTLEAVTPLFVSDSEGVEVSGDHCSFRFYRQDGRLALPASSLRGMVRSLFEAATNSCMILMDRDKRLTRHVTTDEGLRLVPARVVERKGSASGLALELLPGETRISPNERPAGHQYAAWIPQYLGEMLRNSRNVPGPSPYGKRKNLEKGLESFEDGACWAILRSFEHPTKHFRFYSVIDLAKERENLQPGQSGDLVRRGFVHRTYQNIENKHDERFFFRPGADGEQDAQLVLDLPHHVIKEYRRLIEDYQQSHADEVRRRRRAELDPNVPDRTAKSWKKHKAGLSRHITDRDVKDLKAGMTVYALIKSDGNDRTAPADLRVRFLAPVALPRVFFKAAIGARLPYCISDGPDAEAPGNLAPCTHHQRLCPACRTFGWVAPDAKLLDQEEPAAYAGRLRFGLGHLQGEARTMQPTVLAILSAPKPTAKRFYLARDGDKEGYQDAGRQPTWHERQASEAWDDLDNWIRGRKLYRHHGRKGQLRREEYRRAEGRADDQNRTVLDALQPGCSFVFEIDFENLAPLELGALIWTLELEGGACHRLGYAKPLGFGSVRVSIDQLSLLSPTERYGTSACGAGRRDKTASKADYVETFKRAMVETYGRDLGEFMKLPSIQDLLELLSDSKKDLPIHYPRTGEDPDPEGKNFEWFMNNKRGPGYVLRRPQEDDGLPLVQKPRKG